MVRSFCTSKVLPAPIFNVPPNKDMSPLPVHVAPPLLLSVRDKCLAAVPLIDSSPLAFVVPPPTIPLLVHLVVPATLSVPVPVSSPDWVRLDALDALLVLTSRVPELSMTVPNVAPGPVRCTVPPDIAVVPPML